MIISCFFQTINYFCMYTAAQNSQVSLMHRSLVLPFIQILSFTAIGTPASGPVYVPSCNSFFYFFCTCICFFFIRIKICMHCYLLCSQSGQRLPSHHPVTLTSRCLIFARQLQSCHRFQFHNLSPLYEFPFIIRWSSVPDTVLLLHFGAFASIASLLSPFVTTSSRNTF